MPSPFNVHHVPSLSSLAATGGPTIGTLFRDVVSRHAESCAIRSGAKRISYAQLNARVNRLANTLLAMGCVAGDRVGILSENRPEYIEAVLACAKVGLIAACQNWRQSAPELFYCLKLVEPKILLMSGRYNSIADELDLGSAQVICFDQGYEPLLGMASADEPEAVVDAESGLLILYTSGTTGRPKGALISHRAMLARGLVKMVDWSIKPTDGFIAWSPFYHMASADPSLAVLTQGGTITVIDGFNADAVAEALEEEACGWFILMPGMIERMIEALKARGGKVKRVAAAGCMANLVPPEQIAEISRLLNAPYLNSFGSTETGVGPASGAMIQPGVAPKSFGKLQSSLCQVRLLDDNDIEVPAGEIGEMCVRSPMLFSGYWNAESVTSHEFRGGWFHMGDDFRRNPDGTLDYIDRRKYLIKSGGENIYPAEIERVLKASTRIEEVAVVRQFDDTWGEIPVAFVVPRDPDVTENDVLAMLDGQIARYKRPKRVLFISAEDIIRNTTGKIQRDLLEARLRRESR